MRLYTHHDPNFNIIDSEIDLNKSLYYSEEDWSEFKRAYDWLFEIIGTDQVVWCYPSDDNYDWAHGFEEKLWVLDVPEEYVIGSIDDTVWHHVISDTHYIPEAFYNNIPEDKIDSVIEKWESENKKEKTWEWYLFDKTFQSQTLIRAPVKKEWVVQVHWFCGYETEMIEDGIKTRLFDTNEERDKFVEIYKSFLDSRISNYKIEIADKKLRIEWNDL